MKKVLTCLVIGFVLIRCSNTTEEKNKVVDTTIIGSDNPHPAPDTTGMNKEDSLKK